MIRMLAHVTLDTALVCWLQAINATTIIKIRFDWAGFSIVKCMTCSAWTSRRWLVVCWPGRVYFRFIARSGTLDGFWVRAHFGIAGCKGTTVFFLTEVEIVGKRASSQEGHKNKSPCVLRTVLSLVPAGQGPEGSPSQCGIWRYISWSFVSSV